MPSSRPRAESRGIATTLVEVEVPEEHPAHSETANTPAAHVVELMGS